MNAVEIGFEGMDEKSWASAAKDFALAVLKTLGKDGWDLSLLFCGDDFIRNLNSEYRSKDEPTDVLSFEQGGEYESAEGDRRFLAGDIVISLERLTFNAAEFGVSEEEELKRLLIHGILHLSGFEHEDNDPLRPMLLRQEEILRELSVAELSWSMKA